MSHTPQKELNAKLLQVMADIPIGSKYTHYKNSDQVYQVVAVGFYESTEEPCIVYVAQYGKKLVWIRTYSNFTEEVELNGTRVSRFQKA